MSANQVVPIQNADIERVLLTGDLSKLTPDQRLSYYNNVCSSLGLNPLTKPFAYLSLNGKTVLYALKDCTEQLRNIHAISLTIPVREVIEGVYVVTAHAVRADGRCDEATGAVPIEGLKGEARANALMKAETKAKRRVTLSICGLGMLDETEADSIPGAHPEFPEIDTGGHPVGTREAQEHVRDRKLAAIAQPAAEPAEPSSLPVDKPKVAPKNFEMLEKFASIKADLKKITGDDKKYYEILGAHGRLKSSEIPTVEEGRTIYAQMKECFVGAMEARGVDMKRQKEEQNG
jgi:hypothetical protein